MPQASPRRRSWITRLAGVSARRWQVTLAAWLALIVVGIYSYTSGLSREGFPPVNVPFALVDGTFFNDDPEIVDEEVARPLAEAFTDIDGVKEIQSFAVTDAFAVAVEFDSSLSSVEGAALLEAALPPLPPEADATVRSVDATKFLDTYDILVSVRGPDGVTAEELEAQAAVVVEAFEALEAVELAEIRDLLTEGVDTVTGESVIRQTRFTRVAFAGDTAYSEAVTVGLVRNDAEGLDILEFSDVVSDRLEAPLGLAPGFEAVVTADFATDIRNQLSSLTGNLLTGLAAVAVVSLLLIGWRTALVTAGFMATVMLTALVGLWVFGYSLNTITLFGLILTLGLLVDDAIVVSESIDASAREAADDEEGDADSGGAPDGRTRWGSLGGDGSRELAVIDTAVDRVGSASLAGTLTTVLVFAPMLFVSGILGEFIRAIPATVIITLIVSFLISMTVIPALGRAFLVGARRQRNPVANLEQRVAGRLGRLAAYPSGRGWRGRLVGLALVVGAFAMIVSSFGTAAGLGFNIFPPTKDSNAIVITADYDVGTTIEAAQDIATRIDEIVISELGDDMRRSQYVRGNERTLLTFVDLTPFDERSTRSPTYADRIEERVVDIAGARFTVSPADVGPPVEDYPFAVQIAVDDSQVQAGQALASELRDALVGARLDPASGDSTVIEDAIISTEGTVQRTDGERQIEVRARFDNDDLTSNLNAAEDYVDDLYSPDDVAAFGLADDALDYDFGQESDNQDDFASLGVALLVALVSMLALLVVQFRSIVQPLLIFLAIPFSFFGVFNMLSLTDNPISFFVAVGFIALIGVAVNNSILLVDAANQGRREGLTAADAIGRAVTRRFRPLVATTATTVVGLLPLALSDPFWESLSFTLIGGLLSSTLLVLVVLPVFYLAVEAVRTPVRAWGSRLMMRSRQTRRTDAG